MFTCNTTDSVYSLIKLFNEYLNTGGLFYKSLNVINKLSPIHNNKKIISYLTHTNTRARTDGRTRTHNSDMN